MDKLDVYTKKVDDWMAKYPTITGYDYLTSLESQFGYSKVYFFCAALMAAGTSLYLLGGIKLISDLVGFVYPAYASFKAIDSADPNDDTQWLTYWVVFALFSILESAASFLVSYIPFYFFIKLSFLVWLYHPNTMGAGVVYVQVIRPNVLGYIGGEDKKKD
mmetsp:Transcript_25811/g.48599  ORF Transcript_25811/g.48599 Transcript_25811/m.48599 type:complete len:161 (-) Transcript_25811:173-655(-)|eukprot:CAMPEP_0182519126 /NCGR_PEP_ID=MMETSP1321-20130603/44932_1 /TAXON_ID=91990 /ORGANISM="Bolidomonas sp., Strain RCC1657" /LENGTH=160 /DNA_ID=CAMNT_0024727083 /DNA_START=1038 /DNA_END=1520 /DNA_ORIENTATION=-